MHFMHADSPINSIKFNPIYLNYSSTSSGDSKLLETASEHDHVANNVRKSVHENENLDYRPLLNRRQHRTKNRRKKAELDFKQSNKILNNNKSFKRFENKKNHHHKSNKNNYKNKFMTGNDLSSHQVFTQIHDQTTRSRRVANVTKSNQIDDDDRSSKIDDFDRKKRTNKRTTGSLTNLFYQYTALMQSQLLPALFMYNNTTQLLPSITLSSDSQHLTNSHSNNLLTAELSSISSFKRPKVALLTSTNHSTYEPTYTTFNTSYDFSLNDLPSPVRQPEWFNQSNTYLDNDQNLALNSTNTSTNLTLLPSIELLNLSLLLTILISAIMVLCILVTAIGNLFVIAAILSDRVLRSVQNYLVLSLALADLMVSLLVMPLAAVYEIQGHWTLGVILCDIWTWADVLCCTASILHLLAIAVDRYWAVTSVEYMRSRSSGKILGLIAMVWFVALLVSVGPLLGWKDSNFEKRLNEEGVCSYSQDLSYQLFATVSTFYAPLIFILLLYWRIFQVARKRLRNKPGNNQLLKSSRTAQRESTKTSAIQPDTQQNSGSLPNEDSTSSCSRTNSKYCKSITNANDDQTERIESTDLAVRKQTSQEAQFQDTNNNALMQSTTDLSSSVNSPATTIIELHSSTNTPMHLIDNAAAQNGSLHASATHQANNALEQQNCQAELLPMKQLSSGKAFSVVIADNDTRTTTTLILAEESSTQFNVDEQLVVTCNGGESDETKNSIKKNKSSGKQVNQSNVSKEMAARLKQKQQQDSKRERKTARILAIITGVFVICWLPFFVLTLLKALIPKYRDYTLLFSIFLWLGYINSSLNPAIYTIFSPDFRSAFKKLIKGRRQN